MQAPSTSSESTQTAATNAFAAFGAQTGPKPVFPPRATTAISSKVNVFGTEGSAFPSIATAPKMGKSGMPLPSAQDGGSKRLFAPHCRSQSAPFSFTIGGDCDEVIAELPGRRHLVEGVSYDLPSRFGVPRKLGTFVV